MLKRTACIMVVLLASVIFLQVNATAGDLQKDEVLTIAKKALKDKGYEVEAVKVVYDKDNVLWQKKVSELTVKDTNPNYGVLVRGFLKNYKTVVFEFTKQPFKKVWVFIDKDTGEVLEIYKEQ